MNYPRLVVARVDVREFAADLDALRSHVDTGGSESAKAAWDAALPEFRKACAEYATAIAEPDATAEEPAAAPVQPNPRMPAHDPLDAGRLCTICKRVIEEGGFCACQ